jgi:molecular chaperone DnaJ
MAQSDGASSIKRDYYEVLGLSKAATPEDIKRSFRRKAKECHPDTNSSAEAEGMFKELGEAYEVLSDPKKRQLYDAYGHDGLRSGGGSYGGGASGWGSADGFPSDIGDLFSSIFGGGMGGAGFRSGRQGGPQMGDDVHIELALEFKEACFGVAKTVAVKRLEQCDTCHGSGASEGSQPVGCATCGGNGQIRQTTQTIIGHFTQIVTCPRCQGQGQVIDNPCRPCSGKGRKINRNPDHP